MAMFSELAGGSEKFAIDMEGISKLCEQIDIDPESDVRVLVLLWKLGANDRPGEISKEEFLGGCTRLGVDSASKIQGLMPSLDLGECLRCVGIVFLYQHLLQRRSRISPNIIVIYIIYYIG